MRQTILPQLALRDAARDDGLLDEYRSLEGESQFGFARELGQTRNREMRDLVQDGFGIHHAGMLRSDRNLMERLFEARLVKVCILPILFSHFPQLVNTHRAKGSLLYSHFGLGC